MKTDNFKDLLREKDLIIPGYFYFIRSFYEKRFN